MIKAIIFDVGGVLRYDTDQTIQRDIQEALGITPETFTKPWRQLTEQLGRGEIEESAFWQKLHHLTGATKPVPNESLLMREYTKRHRLNTDVMRLVNRLRTAGYQTAILSNTVACHAEFNRAHRVYEGFAPVVLSHEVHLLKPGPEIYHYTLNQLRISPPEGVMIDDREKNITGAVNVGMDAILFTDAPHLEAELQRRLTF